MQLFPYYISGICGILKPVTEHIRSGVPSQLFIENQECLKGNKPFSTKTSSTVALQPVTEKPFPFPLTESEDVMSPMASRNRKQGMGKETNSKMAAVALQ